MVAYLSCFTVYNSNVSVVCLQPQVHVITERFDELKGRSIVVVKWVGCHCVVGGREREERACFN